MLKKDSKNLSYKTSLKPSLSILYEKAHRELYGMKVFVSESKYKCFEECSMELRKRNMDEKKYAYAIARLLEEWLKKRNLKTIPVNMFCGDWCIERYAKISGSETVDIGKENKDEELLHSELLIARYYISKNLGDDVIKFKDAVEDLHLMLSPKWLELYKSNSSRNKFVSKAVDILSEEFSVGISRDYNDIVGKLRCN
jgi:hypothetical protein